jgi:AGZA family xanthine/uracil permease-like MFS transporter
MSALHRFNSRCNTFFGPYFHFAERDTDFVSEVRGGLVTFLTMSYILLVNPQILSDWIGGENTEAFPELRQAFEGNVATSTAIVCCVGTMVIGLLTNLPFAVGPALSMNTFLAASVLLMRTKEDYPRSRASWDVACTAALFAGAVTFLAGAADLSPRVLRALPPVLKSSIRVGIGMFQAFVAFRVLRVIESDPTELLHFVSKYDFSNHEEDGTIAQILFAAGVFLTSCLYIAKVRAAIIVSIGLATVICWIFSTGGVRFPSTPLHTPIFDQTFWSFNFNSYFSDLSAVLATASYSLITMFDVGGAMFAIMALARNTPTIDATAEGVDEEEGGLLEHSQAVTDHEARLTFITIGLSSMLSAVLGGSPCTVFLESIAGVASGARTGFASVVTSFLFFCSLPLIPVFRSVPACAACPALVLIGCFMMGSAADIPWNDHKLAMPAFLTIILMPFTASITPGIVAGIVTYVVMKYADKATRKVQLWSLRRRREISR